MQDAITQGELHPIHSSGYLPPSISEPPGQLGLELAEHNQPTEILKSEPPVAGVPFTNAPDPTDPQLVLLSRTMIR